MVDNVRARGDEAFNDLLQFPGLGRSESGATGVATVLWMDFLMVLVLNGT